MTSVLLSVVIATHNRCGLLAGALSSLARQTWPAAQTEIVVVDNGSTDATREVVEEASLVPGSAAIKYLVEPRPGKSHAVNAGVEASDGDIVVFTDDDVTASAQWLEAMARAMGETCADFAVGRILPRWGGAVPDWLEPALYGIIAVPDNGSRRAVIRIGENDHIMALGANMAVRRRVLDGLGGWHTSLGKLRHTLRSGEDHEFFLRLLDARLTGVYEPEAVVHHLVPAHRLSRDYFRRWSYENGKAVASIERFHPSTDRYILGVPRYLWREALAEAWRGARALVSFDSRQRFSAGVQLRWFAGYLGGAWLSGKP